MYKAGRLKIQTSKGNFVFSIFKYENAKKFLQIIKTDMMTPWAKLIKQIEYKKYKDRGLKNSRSL